MTKTLKLFSLLFVLFFAAVSADPQTDEDKFRALVFEKYRLTVTESDPEHHCFKLSNKLVYNIPKKNWETDALPDVGDRVLLNPMLRHYHHRSTHIEQGELGVNFCGPDGKLPLKGKANVWISDESEYQLFFVGGDLVRTESGWFSDVFKEVMLLSDGSAWTRKSEKKNVFSTGDRIIVSKFSDNEYILIDLDKSFRFDMSGGKIFGMLAYEKVEPFDRTKITKE